MNIIIGSLVRHALGVLGAILATKGIVAPEQAAVLVTPESETIAGVVMAVLAQGWSIFNKVKK